MDTNTNHPRHLVTPATVVQIRFMASKPAGLQAPYNASYAIAHYVGGVCKTYMFERTLADARVVTRGGHQGVKVLTGADVIPTNGPTFCWAEDPEEAAYLASKGLVEETEADHLAGRNLYRRKTARLVWVEE